MRLTVLLATLGLAACGSDPAPPPTPPVVTPTPVPRPAFRMLVHGGAGSMPRDTPAEVRAAYVASLRAALRDGCDALDAGRSSLDAVQLVIVRLEDDPLFNAGRGAVLTAAGTHELDASLMRGEDHACGAVASVRTVRHPIELARAVMEHTRHVLLVGEGAEAFAVERAMEPVDNSFFTTEERRRRWEADHPDPDEHGTVGAVALDRDGHLAAGTSTGGLSNKRWGRVGDSPIVGAGTYADDATCAVSATGTGEEFIRHGVARAISARMALAGESAGDAAEHLIRRTLQPGDGGVIVLGHDGEVAWPYSTGGMFRGRCGPDGELEVRIWEGPEPG